MKNQAGLFLLFLWLPFAASAQNSAGRVHDSGLGIAIFSGSSVFYSRSINPVNTNHTYLDVGLHMEEEGLSIRQDPFLVDEYGYSTMQVAPKQRYYLDAGWGWRHLWFRDSMAGTFLPHTSVEGGISGYIAQFGKLREFFLDTSLRWTPYLQAGFGASIYTGSIIYRFEMGYHASLPLIDESLFPPFRGAYLMVIWSNAKGAR